MAIRGIALILASETLGAGLELLSPNNEPLGQLLTAISLVVYALAAFLLLWEWLTGRLSRPTGSGSIPTPRDPSKTERLLIQSTSAKMIASGQHNHTLDTVAMIEDIQAGRSLQGPCGLCGKP